MMHQTTSIIQAYQDYCQRYDQFIIATVVEVTGSTYHRPGTRMLISPEGQHVGSISGGCLEKDLLQKADWHLQRADTALIEYDTRMEDDLEDSELPTGPFNTGCSGIVYVLLERVASQRVVKSNHTLQLQVNASTTGQSCSSLTVYRSHHPDWTVGQTLTDDLITLQTDKAISCHQLNFAAHQIDVLYEQIDPPKQLWIFGAGDDVLPLVDIANTLHWQVTVIDRRSQLANKSRFPYATVVNTPDDNYISTARHPDYCVAMTHNIARDAALLPLLIDLKPAYIGLLGPAARFDRLKRYWHANQQTTMNDAACASIHAPIGLNIGADNAREIALAISADIIADARQRNGQTLSQTTRPLHQPVLKQLHDVETALAKQA